MAGRKAQARPVFLELARVHWKWVRASLWEEGPRTGGRQQEAC